MVYALKDCFIPPQTANLNKQCLNFDVTLDCQLLADIPVNEFEYNAPWDDTGDNLPWRASYSLDDIYVSYSQEAGDLQYAINGIHFNWCQLDEAGTSCEASQ